MIKLTCKAIEFYSQNDEKRFFEGLNEIKSIIKQDGWYDEWYLYFDNNIIPDNDLRELISLFFRYKVDMKQLQIFLTIENKKWFKSKGYWYYRVWRA